MRSIEAETGHLWRILEFWEYFLFAEGAGSNCHLIIITNPVEAEVTSLTFGLINSTFADAGYHHYSLKILS